jgi:hypothetical protein
MFCSELTQDGHTKRFTITRGGTGWEIRVEYDSHIVHKHIYTDWHRVERARQMFAIENQIDPAPQLAQ